MQFVPVLEIHHGKCVHIESNAKRVNTIVTEDVMQVVDGWINKGVERIHLIDIDAIKSGEPENVDIVSKIKQKYPQLCIQVLGGINSVDSAFVWVDGGADFIVLNGKSIRQRHLLDDICMAFPQSVLVEVDSQCGNVGMGSGEPTFKLTTLAKQLEDDGIAGLLVTEVSQSLHQKGSSLLDIGDLCKTINIPIYVNVGLRKVDDLKQLLNAEVERPFSLLIGQNAYDVFANDDSSIREAS